MFTEKTIKRFIAKIQINPETECWEWTAGLTTDGYGKFNVGGQTMRAHRFSWFLYRGDIPDNLIIRHKCDNPKCVNPTHMELGTISDNVQDRVSRGRGANGERNGSSKLTENDIHAIRNMFLDGYNNSQIAKHFGVDGSAISQIRRGLKWKFIKT